MSCRGTWLLVAPLKVSAVAGPLSAAGVTLIPRYRQTEADAQRSAGPVPQRLEALPDSEGHGRMRATP